VFIVFDLSLIQLSVTTPRLVDKIFKYLQELLSVALQIQKIKVNEPVGFSLPSGAGITY